MDISKEIKSAIDELDSNQLKSAKKCVEEAKKKGNVGRPSGVPTEEAALRSYLRKAKLAVPGKRGRGTLEATKEVLQKRMDFLIREYKLTKSVINEVFKEDIEKIKAKEDIVLGPTYKKRESDKKSAAENEVKREEASVVKSKSMIKDRKGEMEFGYKPTPRYGESTKIAAAEDLEQAKKKLAKLAKAEEKRLKELKDIEVKRGLVLTEGEKDRQKKETEQMEKEDLEQRNIMKQRDKEQKEKEKKELDEKKKQRDKEQREKEQKEAEERYIKDTPKRERREREEKEKKAFINKLKKENENDKDESDSEDELIGADYERIWEEHLAQKKRKENKEIEDLLEKFKEGGYKSRKQAEELSKSSKANKYPDYTPKIKKYIGRYNKIVLEKIAKKKELEGSGREGRKSLRQSLVLQLIRPTNLNMNTRDF